VFCEGDSSNDISNFSPREVAPRDGNLHRETDSVTPAIATNVWRARWRVCIHAMVMDKVHGVMLTHPHRSRNGRYVTSIGC
jgi:hypothetical protein